MVANTQSKVDQHFAKQELRRLLTLRSRIHAEHTDEATNGHRKGLDLAIKATREFLKTNRAVLPVVKKGHARQTANV